MKSVSDTAYLLYQKTIEKIGIWKDTERYLRKWSRKRRSQGAAAALRSRWTIWYSSKNEVDVQRNAYKKI